MESRRRCLCVSQRCTDHPQGFRLLSPKEYRVHQKQEVAFLAKATNAHSETDRSLGAIRDAFQRYNEVDFQPNALTFQIEANSGQSVASARAVLLRHDPMNLGVLLYEEWHKESIKLLNDISRSVHDRHTQAVSLIEDLSILYSQTLSKIELQLRSGLRHEAEVQPYSKYTASLLESEIVRGIKAYQFAHSPPQLSSNVSFSKANHQPPRVHLSPGQLQWTDHMIKELSGQNEIPTTRREELLEGLEEHRRNVTADFDRETFQRRYPHLTVRAIIKNSYKPILLFGHSIVLIAMMVISLKLFHHVSRRALSEILHGLQTILTSFKLPDASIKSMSQDPRTYERVFDLNVQEELFAVCPKCASSYPLDVHGSPPILTCNSVAGLSGQQCGESLIQGDQGKEKPIITFRYQKIEDWLHNLLSKPGMIEVVEKSWTSAQGEAKNPASDFWDGQFIREMKGPGEQKAFREVPKNETRLMFSLAIDWFNPYHNKIAGKTASIGIIVMTCLNLPPEDRYKDQNVYLVGILPGPTQESQLNSILEPLVKSLMGLWEMGIYFVGIPGHEAARLVRGALVQLICDLPAARKVAGFPGHSATYNCSVCLASHKESSDINSLHGRFMERSYEQHIKHAKEYKRILEKEGAKAAERFLKNTRGAVRWSVLNELPYWDPIKCVVLDSMHLLLLGLCQFHWRRFWNANFVPKHSSNPTKPAVPQTPLRNADTTGNEPEKEESDEIDEDNSDSSEEGNSSSADEVVRDKKPRSKYLAADKMNHVRRQWIYATDERLHCLTASEMLCLLKENGGCLPESQIKKAELVNLLIACRKRFTDLPRRPSRRSTIAPRMTNELPRSGDLVAQQAVKSSSELNLHDTKRIKIPVLSPDPAKTSFITRGELNEIQMDIKSIIVPSWFTTIRPTFGEKSNGKLKADEWRSVFTTYLPITFLRLWGESASHRIQLKSLLCLTILVNIVTSKTSSASGQELYNDTIKTYLKCLHEAKPTCSFVINHHLALHLTKFMALHGPCRSHWAFPFERMIGKLQKTLHNSRMADIPRILSRSFTSGAVLEALYQQGIHSALCSRWYRSSISHTQKEKYAALSEQQRSQIEDLYGHTITRALILSELVLDGMKYRCAREDGPSGDANIGYLTQQTPQVYTVGKIQQILKVYTRGNGIEEVVLMVQRYKAAPTPFSTKVWDDIFAHRALGLLIVGEDIRDEVDIVPLSSLIGHVAVNRFERTYGVALITLQLAKDLHARQRIPE